METVALHGARLGVARMCRALAVPRATYYRHLEAKAPPPRPTPPRPLTVDERRGVLEVLHEPRFADQAPAEVYARLLDENRYVCSERPSTGFLPRTPRSKSGAISWPTRPYRPRRPPPPGSTHRRRRRPTSRRLTKLEPPLSHSR